MNKTIYKEAQSQNPVISDFYAKNLSKHGL